MVSVTIAAAVLAIAIAIESKEQSDKYTIVVLEFTNQTTVSWLRRNKKRPATY